ncbi:sugar phosphate isomerase/epimerase [Thaumarchaeota archaeon SCGC AB-539-E09]|nr:sugar phosphate isomerase/epimerase [Thaumarchaeota archaeon SCGC AB-539-E09]
MKIGIDNYSYHRYFGEIYNGQRKPCYKWNLQDFMHHVNDNHIDIDAISFETCFITLQERKELLSILKDVDYEVIFAWGHPNGFMDVNSNDATKEIIEYIKISNLLGQDVIRIAASSINYYNTPHSIQIDIASKSIKKIINIAEDYEVKLALENHGDFYIYEMLKILENVNSEYLGITFDTGNSLRLQEDCVSALQTYGKRVLIIHAKDVAPEKGIPMSDPAYLNCTVAGKGIVNFKNVFLELKKNKYDGMILIEISRLHSMFEHIDETEIINRGIKYLKELRDQIK